MGAGGIVRILGTGSVVRGLSISWFDGDVGAAVELFLVIPAAHAGVASERVSAPTVTSHPLPTNDALVARDAVGELKLDVDWTSLTLSQLVTCLAVGHLQHIA